MADVVRSRSSEIKAH